MLTVYTTQSCAFCPMVKKYLTIKNVPFQEVDITNNTDVRDQLHRATGFMTVPVTTDGSDFVVGFKPGLLAKFAS